MAKRTSGSAAGARIVAPSELADAIEGRARERR